MSPTSPQQLFRALNAANKRETRLRKRAEERAGPRWRRGRFSRLPRGWLSWLLGSAPLALYSLALLLYGGSHYLGYPALGSAAWLFLLLFYLSTFAMPFFVLWLYRQPLRERIGNPSGTILAGASITATIDAKMLPMIMELPIDEIEIVHLEIKAEKERFERWILLLVGAIEKIGVFPGLLALFLSAQSLSDAVSPWIEGIAFGIGALYLFGAYAQRHTMRLDRLLKVLDLAMMRKKAAEEKI